MMKFVKYGLLILAASIVIFDIAFGLLKMKNKPGTAIPSPKIEATSQKTSTFSLENAPKESLKGKITTMTGEVSWQGRTATESAKISSPITIQQGEKLSTGKNSNLSLVFPDASLVNFSQNTEIEIVQTLAANIVFSQTSGTGNYVKTGNYPVSVRAMSLLVDVDGDIVVSLDPENPVTSLSLKSGKTTAAYNDLENVSHEVTLTAGQTFTFNDDTREGDLE